MAELRSTVQDFPLTLAALLRHAGDVHPESPVQTCRTVPWRSTALRPAGSVRP